MLWPLSLPELCGPPCIALEQWPLAGTMLVAPSHHHDAAAVTFFSKLHLLARIKSRHEERRIKRTQITLPASAHERLSWAMDHAASQKRLCVPPGVLPVITHNISPRELWMTTPMDAPERFPKSKVISYVLT
eukprot:1152265-Pelagomonas_calceolata.AAC.6